MIVPAPLSPPGQGRKELWLRRKIVLSPSLSFLPFLHSLSIQVMSTLRERGAYSICIKSLSPLPSSPNSGTGPRKCPLGTPPLRGGRSSGGGIRKNIQTALPWRQTESSLRRSLFSTSPCWAIFMIDKETPSSSPSPSTSFVLFLLLSIKELFSLRRCCQGLYSPLSTCSKTSPFNNCNLFEFSILNTAFFIQSFERIER